MELEFPSDSVFPFEPELPPIPVSPSEPEFPPVPVFPSESGSLLESEFKGLKSSFFCNHLISFFILS